MILPHTFFSSIKVLAAWWKMMIPCGRFSCPTSLLAKSARPKQIRVEEGNRKTCPSNAGTAATTTSVRASEDTGTVQQTYDNCSGTKDCPVSCVQYVNSGACSWTTQDKNPEHCYALIFSPGMCALTLYRYSSTPTYTHSATSQAHTHIHYMLTHP